MTTTLDDRTQKLLLKLRKGADASLSLPQLCKVLTLLGGWGIEKVVQLIAMDPFFNSDAKEWAELEHARLSGLVVQSLPEVPELGRTYVQDLTPIEAKSTFGSRPYYSITYKAWMGCPGYRFTSPDGDVFTVLPGKYEASRKGVDVRSLTRSLHLYDVLPWLKKETSYLAQISALLGMEPHEPSAPRTRDNTGTCAVCFRNIKLHHDGSKSPTMVLHGYNRPGHGYVVGRCWGGTYQPYEKSYEGTQVILKNVQDRLASQIAYHETLSDPNLTEFNPYKWTPSFIREIKLTTKEEANKFGPTWESKLKAHMEENARQIKATERDRDVYQWLITNWKVRDLPKEGEKVVEYFNEAWTAVVRAEAEKT